ncbi:MAG: hypothetical protein JWP29_4180 [Rhodoferax sp.]|nr:hypothetical protein [Rhodoferax sp.]
MNTATSTPATRPMETTDGSHQPADGADVGGIPANLQHGLFDDDAASGTPAAGEPLDADWSTQEAAAKGDHEPDASTGKAPTERREPGHIDSALESLGEAISEPVREAAEEMWDTVDSGKPRKEGR